MRSIVLFAVFALVFTGCGTVGDDGPPPTPTEEPICSTADGEVVYTLMEGFVQEWEDALAIATSTGRIALSGPVGELQSIRRDVQRQDWPECADTAHGYLIDYMDGIIDSLLAFMQQKPESEINGMIADARNSEAQFIAELRKLRP